MATVIAVLDISAINLALPSIAKDLGLNIRDALWLSKANLIACAIAILPCAALGDVIGHRQMLNVGLFTIATTSALTALSSDLVLLISLRALQGCAGAAIMCSTLVLVREIFPRNRLGAALGINALFIAVATTAGPALSGLILFSLSWRWLFALSPVLALIALLIGRICLPDKRLEGCCFDWIGTLLLTETAASFLGWSLYPSFSWIGAVAALSTLLFVLHQYQARWPIMPLSVFGNARFDYALLASIIAFTGQSSVFIALPLVFQQHMGYSPLAAAALFMPWPLVTAIVGPWAGKYADQNSPRLMALLGITVFATGVALLAILPSSPSPLDILWRTAICGGGFGLFQSPNNREILTNVLPEHIARGAALLSSARLVGQAMGAVLVGAIYVGTQQPPTIAAENNGLLDLLLSVTAFQIGSLSLGVLVWFFLPLGPFKADSGAMDQLTPEPSDQLRTCEAIGPSVRPDSNR
ncbi:MFS transporter [Xanthomonas sp. WHRI 1810A]|uniref:MFS transporter n=1 Tax=Xanthomonas sp. WHRI 1810A TaxID=3161565 RepID=UPI0032E90F9D